MRGSNFRPWRADLRDRISNTKREHSAKVNFGMMDIEMVVSAATAAEKVFF
jgi:hypothetical protein